MQRIAVLERRMRVLVVKRDKTDANIAEISAIEWAVPILEQWVADKFGNLPLREKWFKHEKQAIRAQLWARDGGVCYLCNEPMNYRDASIDHEIPLAKEGKDDITNYRLVHPACNLEKGNMLLEVYREWQAGKRKIMS